MAAEEDDGSEWGIGPAAVEALTPDVIVAMSQVEAERLTPRDMEFMSVEQIRAVQAHPHYRMFFSASQREVVLEKLKEAAERSAEAATARAESAEARARIEKPIWEWHHGPDPSVDTLISTSSKRKSEKDPDVEDDSEHTPKGQQAGRKRKIKKG